MMTLGERRRVYGRSSFTVGDLFEQLGVKLRLLPFLNG